MTVLNRFDSRDYDAANYGVVECSKQGENQYLVRAMINGHVAALFPKYVKMIETGISSREWEGHKPITCFDAKLMVVEGNARNDAGFKRFVKFLEVCRANGIQLDDFMGYVNSVMKEEVLARY